MAIELSGKAKELAEEYDALYTRCMQHEWASQQDYNRLCAIEDEMFYLGYIRSAYREWIARKGK